MDAELIALCNCSRSSTVEGDHTFYGIKDLQPVTNIVTVLDFHYSNSDFLYFKVYFMDDCILIYGGPPILKASCVVIRRSSDPD